MADNASMNDEHAQRRKDFAAGLRTLADAIDADPATPLPWHGAGIECAFYADSAAEYAAIAALVEYDSHEIDDSKPPRFQFRLYGRIGGVRVTVLADPEWACERGETRTVEQVDWTFRGQPVSVAS